MKTEYEMLLSGQEALSRRLDLLSREFYALEKLVHDHVVPMLQSADAKVTGMEKHWMEEKRG